MSLPKNAFIGNVLSPALRLVPSFIIELLGELIGLHVIVRFENEKKTIC